MWIGANRYLIPDLAINTALLYKQTADTLSLLPATGSGPSIGGDCPSNGFVGWPDPRCKAKVLCYAGVSDLIWAPMKETQVTEFNTQPLEFSVQDSETMIESAHSFYEGIKTRRTVRDFSAKAVPREVIELALQAAGTAPSGANMQPWHFVVVSDPSIKHKIRLAAEEEEREFYDHRASAEWLEALAPLGTDASKPFLDTAPLPDCRVPQEVQSHRIRTALEELLHRRVCWHCVRDVADGIALVGSCHADSYAEPDAVSQRDPRSSQGRKSLHAHRSRLPGEGCAGAGYYKEATRSDCQFRLTWDLLWRGMLTLSYCLSLYATSQSPSFWLYCHMCPPLAITTYCSPPAS